MTLLSQPIYTFTSRDFVSLISAAAVKHPSLYLCIRFHNIPCSCSYRQVDIVGNTSETKFSSVGLKNNNNSNKSLRYCRPTFSTTSSLCSSAVLRVSTSRSSCVHARACVCVTFKQKAALYVSAPFGAY